MLILSIDTSTRGCSVAVYADGQLLAAYDLLTERVSSSLLTTLMKNAVEHAGYTLRQLDAVAVAKGPGSYTRLRMSVSNALFFIKALSILLSDKPFTRDLPNCLFSSELASYNLSISNFATRKDDFESTTDSFGSIFAVHATTTIIKNSGIIWIVKTV